MRGTAAAVATALLLPAIAVADPSDAPVAGMTTGPVSALVSANGLVYVGGGFGAVGFDAPGFSGFSKETGAPAPAFTALNGPVTDAASDGAGGFYVLGRFTQAGGTPAHGLAHVLADGSVDPSWFPDPAASFPPFSDITLYRIAFAGSRVYVSGDVGLPSESDERHEPFLKAYNTAGNELSWPADEPNGWVYGMVATPTTVFIGGSFTQVGSAVRSHLASIDAGSGLVTSWTPRGVSYPVQDIRSSADAIFATAGTQLFAFDPQSAVMRWGEVANAPIRAARLVGGTLYVGGDFTTLAGKPRRGLAAVRAADGTLLGWAPDLGGGEYIGGHLSLVTTITGGAGGIFVGGPFTSVNGVTRLGAAAFTATTHALTAWNPSISGGPDQLISVDASTIYATDVWFYGVRLRNGLAAYDLETHRFTSWRPNAQGGSVDALATFDGTVYAGGSFTSIDGHARRHLAAFSSDGRLTAWAPHASHKVLALAATNSRVILGGPFKAVDGIQRHFLASVRRDDGALTGWAPSPNGRVTTLALSQATGTVYFGGLFDAVHGIPRYRVAAVPLTSSAPTSWNPAPNSDGRVVVLRVAGSSVFAGGYFSQIGGAGRCDLAELDAATGDATAWHWSACSGVLGLARAGSHLYVAIGAGDGIQLRAVDTDTGAFTAWNPAPSSYFEGDVVPIVTLPDAVVAGFPGFAEFPGSP